MKIDESLSKQFQIQSEVDLDFVIGQGLGWPIGMQRTSPPEFRRRVLAAGLSYQLHVSIDYALKRYVLPDTYENEIVSVGDATSDYVRDCARAFKRELLALQTGSDPPFGVFGAEITLYRVPHALDTARMLSNRGLLLETLPVLRLCLEMMCWASVAFQLDDNEGEVISLKAQHCISKTKNICPAIGQIYDYLSKFTHWGHVIHGHFLSLNEDRISVVYASVRYRAITLALCLVLIDVLVEIVRCMYLERGENLIQSIQGTLARDVTRNTHRYISNIIESSELIELQEIQSFLS